MFFHEIFYLLQAPKVFQISEFVARLEVYLGFLFSKVIAIQKNGAVVVMHKNSGEKAFIPGWILKIKSQRETFLTTTQAVILAMGDIIAFYIDPKQKADPYYGVGCNVMVLKHSKSGTQASTTFFFLQ